jgi:hypothetical protein
LIEFHQAIAYIETLDWNVYDSDGVLVSMSSLESKVISTIRTYRNRFRMERRESCRVIWLAEVLLMLATDSGVRQPMQVPSTDGTKQQQHQFNANQSLDLSSSVFIAKRDHYLSDAQSKLVQDPLYMEMLTDVLAILR